MDFFFTSLSEDFVILHFGGAIMLHMKWCDRNDSSFPEYLSKKSREMNCDYGKLLCADGEHGESNTLL